MTNKGKKEDRYFRNKSAAMEDRNIPYEANTKVRKQLQNLEKRSEKNKKE